jgi:hypothetical protein
MIDHNGRTAGFHCVTDVEGIKTSVINEALYEVLTAWVLFRRKMTAGAMLRLGHRLERSLDSNFLPESSRLRHAHQGRASLAAHAI